MAESAPNEDNPCEVLKEASVQCNRKETNLKATSNGLILTGNLDLPWSDIITATVSKSRKETSDLKCITITYMQLQSNNKMRLKNVEISFKDESSDIWIKTIKEQCALVEGRPKKLFALVNPMSGSANGQQVFEKKVIPIFEMAEIHTDVHFTERAKHALDIIENQDFSSYDGIVVVGGDGSYHEMIHGLTIQTQKSAGVDYNDMNAALKPLSKPIAVIPTGTGNGISGWLNGAIDVETATLRVVKGEQTKAAVYSVHSDGKLFAMSGLLFGYGFFSDMIKRTDELRWMRRARYPYALLASLFGKKREWKATVEYQQAQDTVKEDGSSAPCSDGAAAAAEADVNVKESGWIKYDKASIFSGVFSFVGNMFKEEGKMICHFNMDHNFLFLDHGCSTFSLLKCLGKYALGKGFEPLPTNLDVIRKVTRFRLKIHPDSTETEGNVSTARAKTAELAQYLNIDGEAKRLDLLELDFRVIPSFVPVFGVKQADI